jgi:hypothetical protein
VEKAVDESGDNKPGVNAGPKTAFGGNARKRACFCRPYEFSPHQKMCDVCNSEDVALGWENIGPSAQKKPILKIFSYNFQTAKILQL